MITNVQDKNISLNATAAEYAGATLEIWSGAVAAIDAAPVGTKLCTMILPTPAFTAAANGQLAKTGVWRTPSALATGVPSFYRIISGSDARMQGSAAMNSGAEMILVDPDNTEAAEILQNRAIEASTLTVTQL